jgi:hypothetical protein
MIHDGRLVMENLVVVRVVLQQLHHHISNLLAYHRRSYVVEMFRIAIDYTVVLVVAVDIIHSL